MVGLMATSKRAYVKRDGPSKTAAASAPIPMLSPATHASTGDPPTPAGGSGSGSCGVTAPFLWVLVHTIFCLCPPRLESLIPPVLWKSYNQIPLALKARFPGDSQSQCQIPRLGSLMWGSEPSQQWEYCSPVCGSPTWQVWDLSLS